MANHGDHYVPLEEHPNDLSIQVSPGEDQVPDAKPQGGRNQKKNSPDLFHLPLSDLLFSTNAGILVTDEKDNLVWVNKVILEYPYLGGDVSIVLNKPAKQVIHYLQEFVAQPRQYLKRINEMMASKKVYYGEEITFKDGSIFLLDYFPLFHEGKFCGTIWQLINRTGKAGMLVSDPGLGTRSLIEMVDRFHIAYCEIGLEGEILSCSPFLCRFTGYEEKELLQSNFVDLCRAGKLQMLNSIRNQRSGLHAKNSFSYELEVVLRDGTCKWMQCHYSCKTDKEGRPRGGMLLLTEITEQKKIQQELEDAKEIAELAQVAQQQFLASMSHDIRTPLNAIIGMTFMMEDTPLNEEQNEYVKVLKNASNILLGMLNGVLDFAKIESGKQEIHQREFDLPGLLLSLVETFSFKLNEKPVKLTCEIDPVIDHIVTGDDILLNQILMNLLSNAEKFTAKGEINLETTVVRKYENIIWIEFRVRDTGIGISKEKLQEIFQDFIQADEDIRVHYGGSGLGLFICKKLVEMLGGQISVESTRGKGTSFVFSLPFTLTDKLLRTGELPKLSKSIFTAENAHVLVVEDNPMNLKYLSSLLYKYGISFDIATDGKNALKKAKEEYYNLILMDMKLPKMNGMEVAKYIREKKTLNSTTPIILVSAAAFQSTLDKAKEVGVNELLAKPYAPDQLISILRKYLVDEEEQEPVEAAPAMDGAFEFDERLDRTYLHKLYSGNCSYAQNLFEVFLECMDSDWGDLQAALHAREWLRLKNLVHKVKPNFSMVGLTAITAEMQEIYDKLREGDYENSVRLLEKVQAEMDEYMPLVKTELERMREFMEQKVSSPS